MNRIANVPLIQPLNRAQGIKIESKIPKNNGYQINIAGFERFDLRVAASSIKKNAFISEFVKYITESQFNEKNGYGFNVKVIYEDTDSIYVDFIDRVGMDNGTTGMSYLLKKMEDVYFRWNFINEQLEKLKNCIQKDSIIIANLD
jgi:hypothetical protein